MSCFFVPEPFFLLVRHCYHVLFIHTHTCSTDHKLIYLHTIFFLFSLHKIQISSPLLAAYAHCLGVAPVYPCLSPLPSNHRRTQNN